MRSRSTPLRSPSLFFLALSLSCSLPLVSCGGSDDAPVYAGGSPSGGGSAGSDQAGAGGGGSGQAGQAGAGQAGSGGSSGEAGSAGGGAGPGGSGGKAGGSGQAGGAGTSGQAGSSGGSGSAGSAGQGGSGEGGGSGQAGSAGSAGSGGGPVPTGKRVRIVAANLTSGSQQSYDPGEGLRILDGLDPDVVLLQEMNYLTDDAGSMQKLADEAVGPGAFWFREATGDIPNGIVSRYPILESGSWADAQVANRGFAWARIDVPGPIDLWAVSVHLLTSSSSKRDAQAGELVSLIGGKVPPGDFLTLGGDFNTTTRTEPCLSTLSSLLSVQGPYPADNLGNDNTNGPRSKPHDWVLTDADLRARELAVSIGQHSFASGLVFDSRVYTPLTEVPPVLAGDSGASGMQHMAVVRDFALEELPATADASARTPGARRTNGRLSL